MFDKILIANRGEIAVRIIRTARRLGIATVAVYSDADANAQHVRLADQAVHIGPAPVAESYLRMDAILDAARKTGAQAIHPGYGFLSENPEFVDAVTTAGLVFIGPSASAIRAMGLKDAAKRLMEQAGVPVVPGYHGAEQDSNFLAQEAARIGYPVLIKARAGGGGKGMRRVDRAEDFSAALEGAQREARAAFGDAACLIEKYITAPRHIEIQVFGDNHGNAVHLYERDCSLQRRHQKVIEEAPAPGMTAEMRAAMGDAAVRAAKAIGYSGAGTIEFIVDGSEGLLPDRFWFMEMNTRLQVEHPVTEAVTGLDLVEWQLRVASGEKLPATQDQIGLNGHAFEARVYAENPGRGFLPATGQLKRLSLQQDLRIDSGVREGDEVSPYYDPMIAKVIAHGPSRQAALRKLKQGLAASEIAGVTTNLAFLTRLAGHSGFAAGQVDTGLIERDMGVLVPDDAPPARAYALAALVLQNCFDRPQSDAPWDQLRGFRHFGHATMPIRVDIGGQTRLVRTTLCGSLASVDVEGQLVTIDIAEKGPRPRVSLDGISQHFGWFRQEWAVSLFLDGETFEAHRPLPGSSGLVMDAGNAITSPMPGTVRMVSARAGDIVKKGAPLIIVEAMKMEHTLTAPRDGTVATVLVSVGDRADDGMLLLTLEDAA
ncbi:acetyl/propionyl/methylcrotonyl-CoA carboxylase subunit alpha [Aureimonas fodinaquatilis]|uniref:Acetyl/propionyl/methylcrotonyl-CoA carboxylase subunit alpha n=1 Tax=Aureimonas fodinaquatilis TaxID=2565783 RepID=A0A5B0DSM2_9HYPH|nr:acetyl/propionyl/methylcrotonyl-CoA carboxylase subunit alpha [Aureimonas fodinaquatilis]KAA0969807.1 acetyl/propionyl/methylcrotonyl-CoA carboxylase subunit alpha [Aureimonas fodinaquatilis]